jgi:hypothetical protein
VIENIVNLISLNPEDVPVVSLCLFVSSLPECFEDTVSERGLELDLTEVVHVMILLYILSKIL